MKRASTLVVLAVILAACGGTQSSGPADQSHAAGQSEAQGSSQAPSGDGGGGGGGGAALAEAAAAVTDWCTLMPADLVAQLVPGEAVLQAEEFPSRCTASNQVQALQISYQEFSGAEPSDEATLVPGLAENAWFELTGFVDDAYLIVILYTDPNGSGASTLYVEMAGHDGVDHADDAVAVAQAVLAQLQ